ncbi:hypothetical protein [Gluconacetobacter tumulisoli]|uniref:Uncharacterized protein n=1 Tax=Gluconacetobacter tumulisoli TaxID=1286189 RepID=A0A7W4K511_9PROT|nr:hypothetical protein [Gluconacetobacter tumulisoli]MBB2200325.1 hypothetical protein [Gluconacetobacter tumulisoli]
MSRPDTPPAAKIVWIVLTVIITIGIGIYVIKAEFDSIRTIQQTPPPAEAPATISPMPATPPAPSAPTH